MEVHRGIKMRSKATTLLGILIIALIFSGITSVSAQSCYTTTTDLRTGAGDVTAQQLDDFIKSVHPDSPLIGLGQSWIDAGNKHGINPVYLMTHAMHETGWGLKNDYLVYTKHNLYGYGAIDSNPNENAMAFSTWQEGIDIIAGKIKENYLTEGGKYFHEEYGATLQGMNVNYASDNNWANGISDIMNMFADWLGKCPDKSSTTPASSGEDHRVTNSIIWEFNTPANSEGWLAYNAGILNEATNVQRDGLFIIDPIGTDPWIENRLCSIDASSIDRIKIKMSSNCEDDTGAIYFSTAESPGFDEDKKVGFGVSHGSEWYEYDILISKNSNWKGTITALRIDPADYGSESPESHDDTFGFDYIRLSGVPTETDTPPSTAVTPDSPTPPPAPVQSTVHTATYCVEDPRIELAIKWAEDKYTAKSNEYYFECLSFVQDAYDKESGANTHITRYAYARKAAEELNAAKNNEGVPPRGAFVFYKWDGDRIPYCTSCGHVGLSIGNGDIIHNYENSIKIQNYKSLKSKVHPYIGWAYPPVTPPINNIYPLSGNLYGSADRKDITGIFDSSTSEFTFGSKSVQFGLDTDIPIIGDWDGDGKDEIGVFRPSDDKGISKFYLVTRNWTDLRDEAWAADVCVDFGPYPTNVPITGDWDGDGHDDIGGFNPENNIFYLYKLDLEAEPPSAESYKDVPFGATRDIPFIGDWDGDSKDELGMFRSPYPVKKPETNAFYCDRKLTGDQHELGDLGTDGKPKPYTYGDIGDYPVIGDWDGDGDDDIGIYRPSNQEFCKDSMIPENPRMGASIAAIIHTYGAHEGDDDYNPVHDVNSDGVIDLSDFVGVLKDTIVDLLNSISL
jgi:hypothetical protein